MLRISNLILMANIILNILISKASSFQHASTMITVSASVHMLPSSVHDAFLSNREIQMIELMSLSLASGARGRALWRRNEQSSSSPLAVHWQSNGSPMAVRWQSTGSPRVQNPESSAFRLFPEVIYTLSPTHVRRRPELPEK